LVGFTGLLKSWFNKNNLYCIWGRCGRDRMVVGFTTTCAISAYH